MLFEMHSVFAKDESVSTETSALCPTKWVDNNVDECRPFRRKCAAECAAECVQRVDVCARAAESTHQHVVAHTGDELDGGWICTELGMCTSVQRRRVMDRV